MSLGRSRAGGKLGGDVAQLDAAQRWHAGTGSGYSRELDAVGLGATPSALYKFYLKAASFPQVTVEGSVDDAVQAALFRLRMAGTSVGYLFAPGANYTTSGSRRASALTVAGLLAGGVVIGAEHASGGARVYTGGTTDLHRRLMIDEAGAWTVDKAGQRSIVTISPTATLETLNLDGNRDLWYRVLSRLSNATASDTSLRFRPNGGTSNLRGQLLQGRNGTAAAAAEAASWFCGSLRPNGETILDLTFWAGGGMRGFVGNCMAYAPGVPDVSVQTVGGIFTDSTGNITSAQIVSDAAAALAVGSRIVYCRPDFLVGA